MANLRDIRDRIASVKSTQQITRAMKMVAAARLRKAQDKMQAARPYSAKMQELVAKLVEKTDTINPLLHSDKKSEKILVLVMGSDRGLCGGFNTNLFRVVENVLRDDFADQLETGTLEMICFGKKSYDYFRKRNYQIVDHKTGFFDNLHYEQVAEVTDKIISDFSAGVYRQVYLAYNEFKSVIAQKRRFSQILPLQAEKLKNELENLPGSGKDNSTGSADETSGDRKNLSDIDYIYEPDSRSILDYVLPLYITIQFWQASLESFASEQGARMTAMDSATDNAGEIINELQLKYNQARQAAITTEISEIVSGAEALSD